MSDETLSFKEHLNHMVETIYNEEVEINKKKGREDWAINKGRIRDKVLKHLIENADE